MARRTFVRGALASVMGLLMLSFLPAFLVTTSVPVQASSHREAPLISQDPVADATDLYSFVSPDKPNTVTFISNWIPYENAASGPNFFRFGDDVLYEIHIDNVGDAQEHIDYQFRFKTLIVNPNTFLYNTGVVGKNSDEQYNERQYMYVTRLDSPSDGSCKNMQLANCPTAKATQLGSDIEVAPANVGPHSFPVYPVTAANVVKDLGNGVTTFAGPRADSFFGDIGSLFDLLTIRQLPGNNGGGVNSFANYNVHTIAIQVPINQLTKDGSTPTDPKSGAAVIGSWITSSRQATKVLSDGGKAPATSGSWVQIERLGMPLVNEIVVPLGVKDTFNNLKPWQDSAALPVVQDPEPARLLHALYGLQVPATPRTDIVTVFLTGVPGLNQPPNVTPSEQLRLNVAIPPTADPSSLGVLGKDLAGFPNGRRPSDDVVDIELRVVAGILVTPDLAPNNELGDGVDEPARAGELTNTFPYLVPPYSGYLAGTTAAEK